MILENRLEQLRNIDIKSIDLSSLTEAKSISFDPSLSIEERFNRYLEQIINPYAFNCNGAVVKIGYSSTEKTLDQSLTHLFAELNSANL